MSGKGWQRWGMMVLLALLAGACATTEVGRKFDTAAADRIEIGKTTDAEVLALLGEPLARRINADGTKAFGYKYVKGEAHFTSPVTVKSSGQADKLVVVFDKNGVVKSLSRANVPAGGGMGSGKKP